MKNKIIGILVFITLIITAIPVLGSVHVSNSQQKNENPPICGTAYIILQGQNESAKIGATVRIYDPIICNVLRNSHRFIEVDVIYQDNPDLPAYGEYCAIFDGCGCYQAQMLKNKGWWGENEPWFILADDKPSEIIIGLTDRSKNIQIHPGLFLSIILEELLANFPFLKLLL